MSHQKPAQIIAAYISTEDDKYHGEDVWKHLQAVHMLVSIKNTNRVVAALDKLNNTFQSISDLDLPNES